MLSVYTIMMLIFGRFVCVGYIKYTCCILVVSVLVFKLVCVCVCVCCVTYGMYYSCLPLTTWT